MTPPEAWTKSDRLKRTLRRVSNRSCATASKSTRPKAKASARVEQALETLATKPGHKVCGAMRGLVEEAQ
jgi:ferritin-like metal-binding protein YciE